MPSISLPQIDRDGSAFLIDAELVAKRFGLSVDQFREALCQDGFGFTNSGAPGDIIHCIPFSTVAQLFQTSALEAESWPPFAKDVSIAA
jgi:hypothetical protein